MCWFNEVCLKNPCSHTIPYSKSNANMKNKILFSSKKNIIYLCVSLFLTNLTNDTSSFAIRVARHFQEWLQISFKLFNREVNSYILGFKKSRSKAKFKYEPCPPIHNLQILNILLVRRKTYDFLLPKYSTITCKFLAYRETKDSRLVWLRYFLEGSACM
jgi:hypothetical protein